MVLPECSLRGGDPGDGGGDDDDDDDDSDNDDKTGDENKSKVRVFSESKLVINPLTGQENWKTWKVQVRDWLKEKKYKSVLERDEPNFLWNDGETRKWVAKDIKVLATIRRNVSDDVLQNLLECEHAKEAWETLCQLYEVTDIVKLINLRRKFFSH